VSLLQCRRLQIKKLSLKKVLSQQRMVPGGSWGHGRARINYINFARFPPAKTARFVNRYKGRTDTIIRRALTCQHAGWQWWWPSRRHAVPPLRAGCSCVCMGQLITTPTAGYFSDDKRKKEKNCRFGYNGEHGLYWRLAPSYRSLRDITPHRLEEEWSEITDVWFSASHNVVCPHYLAFFASER